MRGFAILLGATMLGNAIQKLLSLPLSGNVIALMLLVVSLFAGWIKLAWIEDTAQFLLKHMMIFFAPVIVGTMVFFGAIGAEWLTVAVALLGATLIVLIVTGGLSTWQAGRKKEHSNE
ncbi:CidA/LrgA family protein [Paenibacillus sp. sgz302251]|uniref:CidA/LrgA family protein n=1 Tax=Paenibacillus sp. sgz302251 TaxID=3414493 RepID=UPI003C7ACAED